MAPRMAVATSLLHFTPSPTWPLKSPMATKALNLVRCPALVCFWTGMIFNTSSLRAGPRYRSMISCSLMGREKRWISSRDLILPSLTRRPSLVTGIHSFSSLPLPRRAWCEVQQGSCHRHPWRHHHGKALHCPGEARLLGNEAWEAAHRALQGDWKVRQHLGETHPCSSWNWHCLCSCAQEASPDGRN